jgi:hypothetical protein
VVVARIVSRVRRVNRNVNDHALLRHVAGKFLRQLKTLFAVQFMRQSDFEIPGRLRIVRPVALILAALNGVPQSLTICCPGRRILGSKNPLPFRLAKIPVILDLIGPFVDQLVTSVVSRTRN